MSEHLKNVIDVLCGFHHCLCLTLWCIRFQGDVRLFTWQRVLHVLFCSSFCSYKINTNNLWEIWLSDVSFPCNTLFITLKHKSKKFTLMHYLLSIRHYFRNQLQYSFLVIHSDRLLLLRDPQELFSDLHGIYFTISHGRDSLAAAPVRLSFRFFSASTWMPHIIPSVS